MIECLHISINICYYGDLCVMLFMHTINNAKIYIFVAKETFLPFFFHACKGIYLYLHLVAVCVCTN